MESGVFAFRNSVGTVGIDHHGKKLVVGNEFINQFFKALVMDVIVASAVDDEKLSLKLVSEGDGGAVPVTFRVILRKPHVSFLVDGVVKPLVADKGYGDAHFIKLWIPEKSV
jgi:hypothetical protein